MKNFLFLSAFLLLANPANAQSISKRIDKAVEILASVAANTNLYKVTAGEPKAMMLEFALNEQVVESEEDFESNWKGLSSDAWEADSMNWGLETLKGAESYVTSTLETNLDSSEQTDADKVKFADGVLATKRAFQILRSIKSAKYGVAPTGAVQCGVTFSSLLILDTENGKVHQIIMEGSGC